MGTREAKLSIDEFREIANNAAERAELASERLAHAEADGDEILAACLQAQVKAAEKAAQDIHVACDEMERGLRG